MSPNLSVERRTGIERPFKTSRARGCTIAKVRRTSRKAAPAPKPAGPPDFAIEDGLYSRGHRLIAGVDEVGRGCLAGPVVAGAVILPRNPGFPWLAEIRDSKQLTPERRERLSTLIRESALAFSTGLVGAEVIDMIGIVPATLSAMRQAVKLLVLRPDYVILDYVTVPRLGIPQKGITNGDESCLSIACASIVAKVMRDGLMRELDGQFPGYGFARHKGYGTAQHLASLRKLGPCRLHRNSFAPVGGSIATPGGDEGSE